MYARAFLLERLDRVDEALAELTAMVERSPDDPIALNALGYTLADRTDRIREAYRHVKKAYELAPDNPAIIDSMGWVEYRRGNLDLAIQYLDEAYRRIEDSEVAAHLGEVLWVNGDEDQARVIWLQALDQDPGSAVLQEVMDRFLN